jgi:hypothetical protein
MTGSKTGSVEHQKRGSGFTTTAANPASWWPMTHVAPEAAASQSECTDAPAADGTERDDAVVQLARALRAAERAHGAYRAELRLGDVEPAEHWSTWYAEYLVGLR